ncbi:hypothetical protein [Pedobacter sp.]|uniref:hypothetical protein n=1 Tax=Pedobacter sp. TaxID=1411316 RepID=UPI0031D7102F
MENILIKKTDNKLIGLMAVAFGLAGMWIYLRSRKQKAAQQAFDFAPFSKERYVFNWHKGRRPYQAVVKHEGDCYAVQMNGAYAGVMWRGEGNNNWYTRDKALKPHINEISEQLATVFSLQGFPAILQGNYPEIIAVNWKTSETLELILQAATDLEVFAAFLEDEVPNLVSFPEYLDLIVKKENESYFKIISVNVRRG